MGHGIIDNAFSTDQSPHFMGQAPSMESFTARLQKSLPQTQAEQAVKMGNYEQAVEGFGKAIEMDPKNNDAYLQRAYAFMELGEYDHSLDDYHKFQAQKTPSSSSSSLSNNLDFSIGFAKNLPKGVMESGYQSLTFVAYLITRSHSCEPASSASVANA